MSSIAGMSGQLAQMGMARSSGFTPPTFSSLDSDESGGISLDELKSTLSSGDAAGDARAEAMFSAMDADSDGSISETEKTDFDSAMADRMSAMQVLAQIAGQEDSESSTTSAAASMPPPPPPGAMPPAGGASAEEESDSILEAADSDGDGALSLDEFTSAVTSAAGDDTFSTDDISSVYDLLDSDDDDSVSSDELTSFLASMQSQQRPSGPPPADWMQQANGAYSASTTSAVSSTYSTAA